MTHQVLENLSDAPSINWEVVPWDKAQELVDRLQTRIAKAAEERQYRKVKALQWILTHSFYAKVLAVKRVTSNKGKDTPGVDRKIADTPEKKMKLALSLKRKNYKALPLRRMLIPKADGKKRPLGIPTIRDRAMQALYLLALEPISETFGDPNSYGFRKYRGCADAIAQCFCVFAKRDSVEWVLEGDIVSCFDNISHQWLLENIPIDKRILKSWIKSGVMKDGTFFDTISGTPQGGIISPTLANMALDGLEATAKSVSHCKSMINVIRYADDFVITARTPELIQKIRAAVEAFLKERGLALHPGKTKVVNIREGFDFLSQNVRKYKDKLLIRPARKAILSFRNKVDDLIRKFYSCRQDIMVYKLNHLIRGWGNYHRHIVAKKVFDSLDEVIFRKLFRQMEKLHSKKGKRWIYRKYWYSKANPTGFGVKTKEGKNLKLLKLCDIKIKRRIKVRAEAKPFLPQWFDYFAGRKSSDNLLAC